MTGSFLTIKESTEGLFKNKGSKFFAFTHKVSSEKEVKTIVKQYKKDYYDARHHCYAFILDDLARGGDDGEPSGTAGAPILGQLKTRNLNHVLVIVVRYFGGTKLGVPGLIEAYRGAAEDALEKSEIITEFRKATIQVACTYETMEKVMRAVKTFNLKILAQDFTNDVHYTLEAKLDDLDSVRNELVDFLVENK